MIELLSRRHLLILSAAGLLVSSHAGAFGEEGAFHARLLSTSSDPLKEELSAARRWAWELTRRTSAPGRLATKLVEAKSAELLVEPFLVWAGGKDPGALSARAIRGLREYLRMGGILLVDDREPQAGGGSFGLGARRELSRVLPESAVIRLASDHVIFKTFYILDQPIGRVEGPATIDAIVSGKDAQVIFLNHDLLGALAREGDNWANPMQTGGSEAREQAIRFAVNIAMYVLCSDYKDDQVHAPFLMRKRHRPR